jgi:exonuclease III
VSPAHKSIDEQIAEEKRRSAEALARIAALKARQRAIDRKTDNHRKIIVGGAVMAHMKLDPQFRKEVIAALNKAVTEAKHRSVIPDLLDEHAYQEAMRAAAKKAAQEAAKPDGGASASEAPPSGGR